MSLEIPVRQISQSSSNDTSITKTLYNLKFKQYYYFNPQTPGAV